MNLQIKILCAILALTLPGLSSLAVSQRTQEFEPQRATAEQIRRRPVRIIAKPVNIQFANIVFELINQPDVDLRPTIKTMGISIRNQGGRGTCSVFAVTFLLEYMYAKNKGYMSPDFSEEYLNYASNLAINEYSDGGFFDALDLGYQKYGIVNEAQAPYNSNYNPPYVGSAAILQTGEAITPRFKAHFIKAWDVTTGLTANQLLGIRSQLNSGRPVAVGVRWPNNFATEKIYGVELMKTPPADQVFDGHSIDLVGYKASNSLSEVGKRLDGPLRNPLAQKA